jgi:competence protein ComEA
MSFKTIIAAALFTAAASTAFAQTAQQPTTTNPLRPGQTTPAAPAAPAAPTAPRAAQPAAPAPATAAQPAQRPAAQGTLVNLNTATKDQLDSLPQIGDARAQAIIAKRPYKDWADFVAKNVVPANAEAAIKDKVRFR